jgi:DNA-binding response OmpR family regulator
MTVRHRRALVVEDDASIARLLQMELEHRGMEVQLVSDGRQVLPALARWRPDVVILDILLPGMDGERILYRMRAEGWKTPVLMLTARDGISDKIRNLTTGADDYLTKPFNIDELVARMMAVLRRVEPEEVIRLADLEVDIPARRVRRSGREIRLTTREFELLVVLARNARHVLSRDTLLDRVWNTLDIDPNVVDVYIGYLRKKIDADQPDPLIRTVRGVGFTLRDE